MARLLINGGEYFKVENDGQITPLSEAEYRREAYYQSQMQQMSAGAEFASRAGGYFRDTLSGLRELTYGDPAEEQALRAQTQRELQPFRDYGTFAGSAGEFLAPAATAALPGGLLAQSGIGGLQGAAERPNAPVTGTAIGVGTTLVGDWVGDVLGRMFSRMRATRMDVSPQIRRAEEAGIEFTPGQRTGDIQRQLMETEMAKNPLFAGIDAPRFMRNQARLNDLAANFLGVTPRGGRMTGEMLGEAYDQARAGFRVLDDYDGPVQVDQDALLEAWDALSDEAQPFMERFARNYDSILSGPTTGKQFNQARNFLAEQTRRPGNKRIAGDIQEIIGVMDESVINSVDQATAATLDRARNQWKSMLIIEGAQNSAKSRAGGNVLPQSAYNSLYKYYGRRFRHGRMRDPFLDAVIGMTEAAEAAPVRRPSGNAMLQVQPVEQLLDRFYREPLARRYMQGGNISEVLLGASLMDEAIPGVAPATVGVLRGVMAEDEQQ